MAQPCPRCHARDGFRQRDHRRRRRAHREVPHRHRAPGREDLALEARHAPRPPPRRRRRGQLPRQDEQPRHEPRDRPGADPRPLRQGDHAGGAPVGPREERLRLVADARPRRLRPPPPVRHRPGGLLPDLADREQRRRLDQPHDQRPGGCRRQRPAGRPRGRSRQRGHHGTGRLDSARGRDQRQLHPPGHLLPDRRRLGARLLPVDVREHAGGRGHERLLRRQVDEPPRRHGHHAGGELSDRHRSVRDDGRERRARPRVLRGPGELGVRPGRRHDRAVRELRLRRRRSGDGLDERRRRPARRAPRPPPSPQRATSGTRLPSTSTTLSPRSYRPIPARRSRASSPSPRPPPMQTRRSPRCSSSAPPPARARGRTWARPTRPPPTPSPSTRRR